MSIHIQNDELLVRFNEPGSIYTGSRFDWTSQLIQIHWQNKFTFCGVESMDNSLDSTSGKGLFCEFGIDKPIGFHDCSPGDFFPKIGVGLLKKISNDPYHFHHQYPIQNAKFIVNPISERLISFLCILPQYRGYGFSLEKRYELTSSSLLVNYSLENTGQKDLTTNEYCHNFIAINQLPVNENYRLSFSCDIHQPLISEKANPNDVMDLAGNRLLWKAVPDSDFFLRGLAGKHESVNSWSVENTQAGVGIKETCSFVSGQCNVWGNAHVISPELFFSFSIQSGEQILWQRHYEFYKI